MIKTRRNSSLKLIRRMSFKQGIHHFMYTKEIISLAGLFLLTICYVFYLMNVTEICYGVVLDAGSSGTKAQVYQWPCLRSSQVPRFDLKATQSKKFKKPLAHFSGSIKDLQEYFDQIFEYVNDRVPQQVRHQTPVVLGATAGMRLIDEQDQSDLIKESRRQIRMRGYYFPLSKEEDWCSILTGQQEGAYMWVSVNYLLNVLSFHKSEVSLTVATIDLGGASTQIAFLPKDKRLNSNQSYDFDLIIKGFNDWHIYTYSYLGYGKRRSRKNVLSSQNPYNSEIIYSPCFFAGYEGTERINNSTYIIKGLGVEAECSESILKYLEVNKNNCLFEDIKQCAMQNQYQSLIPASMVIYASSGVQKAANFLGLKNSFTLRNFQYKAHVLYSLTWEEVRDLYREEEDLGSMLYLVTYVQHLLQEGYNIEIDRQIFIPEKINSISPGWNLAFLMQVVSGLSCKDLYGQFCLDTVNEISR